ncbi:MAG: hypothetical protein JNJ40_19025 [Bacteroidia bacterium]|nr:hypothetical protein [Bacteroidia bacterium]
MKKDKSFTYYNKYKIQLRGKISAIKDIDSRECLLKITIDKKNIKEHDLRLSNEDYYLYRNNDTAYAIACCTQAFNIEDKVIIDYKTVMMYVVKKDGGWSEYS